MSALKLSIILFFNAVFHGNGQVFSSGTGNNIRSVTATLDAEGKRHFAIEEVATCPTSY